MQKVRALALSDRSVQHVASGSIEPAEFADDVEVPSQQVSEALVLQEAGQHGLQSVFAHIDARGGDTSTRAAFLAIGKRMKALSQRSISSAAPESRAAGG